MPRFARSRYTPRRPAEKSYSGAMSGSASRGLFIASSFSRCGRPCGDDPNASASVRVDDNKEVAGARRPDRRISNLIGRVVLVIDADGQWVEKDGRGVLEAQSTLGRDPSRLVVVPVNIELHWDTLSASAYLGVIAGQTIGRTADHRGLRDGEADLVIAHPERGILVIEVKAGR